jgi:hypothetical protein
MGWGMLSGGAEGKVWVCLSLGGAFRSLVRARQQRMLAWGALLALRFEGEDAIRISPQVEGICCP